MAKIFWFRLKFYEVPSLLECFLIYKFRFNLRIKNDVLRKVGQKGEEDKKIKEKDKTEYEKCFCFSNKRKSYLED